MGMLIQASIWWFKRSAWPQCHRRGSAETPGGRPTASFGHHITPYIIYIALKWVYKGLGAWENLFWHPFDDSRGLHDPNATGGGLRRPLEVGPQPLLVLISYLISFILPWNEYIRVWGYGKTYSGIHLMIQEVCMTPMPQKWVCGDPWRSAHSLFWS